MTSHGGAPSVVPRLVVATGYSRCPDAYLVDVILVLDPGHVFEHSTGHGLGPEMRERVHDFPEERAQNVTTVSATVPFPSIGTGAPGGIKRRPIFATRRRL